VHAFAEADDHSAPALWESHGQLLIATSQHSGDLFLYTIDNTGRPRLDCVWRGRFTYPRFAEIGGSVRIYVRTEERNGTGDLSTIDIDSGCTKPVDAFLAPIGKWIYAPPPQDRVVWSLYDPVSNKHGGAYIEGRLFDLSPTMMPETLLWSEAGLFTSAVRFSHSFVCCGRGQESMELYYGEERVYASATMPSPYYPSGIVISEDEREGLFPTPRALSRRAIPSFRALSSCTTGTGFNTNPQYVRNGNGAYVWVNFPANYDERKFPDASVMLCIP
jgi:hypothetical protein